MSDETVHGENKEMEQQQAAPVTAETETEQAATDDKKPAKGIVIPLNREAGEEALADAKETLGEAIDNIKTAFAGLKKSLEPLRAGLTDVAGTFKEGADEFRKMTSQAADKVSHAEGTQEAKETSAEPEVRKSPEVLAAKEASEAIASGMNKLKERASNVNFNLKESLQKEFEQFADKNLSESDYTIDENGKRVVKVDAKFMQAHANEVVPQLISGAVGSFFKAILGENIMQTQSAEKAEESESEDQSKDKAESKYAVKFDFSGAVKDAIRNAQVMPEAQTDEQIHEREQGREVLIESAKIVEDSLNGLSTADAKERIEKAIKRVDMDDSEKAPEDIKPIDEKHQKILDLSRQLDQSSHRDGDKE